MTISEVVNFERLGKLRGKNVQFLNSLKQSTCLTAPMTVLDNIGLIINQLCHKNEHFSVISRMYFLTSGMILDI